MSEQPQLNVKQRMAVSALSVIACFIPVHGYRFFHLLATGDGLLQLYQDDAAWEIALGRFLQPFVVMFRGGYTTPFLINLLMVAWLALAVFFASWYLELHTKTSVALVAAFFVINRTLVMLNASYLPWADSYVFSLFLAVCGLWLASKKTGWHIAGAAVLFAMSLGLYQAYICVALGLSAIRLFSDLAQKREWKETIRSLVPEAAAYALSAVLYLAGWKGLQKALGIWSADGYNGMADLGAGLTDAAGGALLGTVYGNVWRYYLDPVRIRVMTFRGMDLGNIWVWIFRIANVCVMALILYDAVRLNRKSQTDAKRRILQVLLLCLFPLCVNLVCLLSGGMQHVLMMYAFQLHYVTAVVMREKAEHGDASSVSLQQEGQESPSPEQGAVSATNGSRSVRRRPFPAVFLPMLAVFILWPQVIYANQIYLKKSLQEEAAQTLMVRVTEAIEGKEGYVPGATPVAFAGSLEHNPYVKDNDLLTDEMPWGEMKTAFTYGGMEAKWLAAFEHMKVNTDADLPEGGAVDVMPCFPLEGSVAYVDGVLVVKLSE